MLMPIGVTTVTDAVPDAEPSARDVALTVTTAGFGALAGAV
jgi:hypothetical protein